MKSQTQSPARLTSSRCAGSALTEGIAMNSRSSDCQVSFMGRDSTQIARTAAKLTCFVRRVQERARLEREAAAADARRQAAADRFQGLDALVELLPPARRQARPVTFRRRFAGGKRVERLLDALERDACCLARLDEGDPAQRDARVTALVSVCSLRRDQPLPLVKAKRRLRDATP